jgi:RTX calcium-binding nonapeptide repeat (4 copies)
MGRARIATAVAVAATLGVVLLSCSRTDVDTARPTGDAVTDSGETPMGHMPPGHNGLIHGTKGYDVIAGSAADETIDALAGRDRVDAGPGNDTLIGGPDPDVLIGGPGDDAYVVANGDGGDILIEEGGTDTLELTGVTNPSAIEVLRHGDDVLVRWSRNNPLDAVLIRSWFANPKYRVERIQIAHALARTC